MNTLNPDQVTGLLNILPDKEDIKVIKGYEGDPALLGEAERFYVTLLKVNEWVPVTCYLATSHVLPINQSRVT